MKKLFTSESVACGHPDKMCDQISDAILDAILVEDPFARVACEVMVTTGIVFVAGEITTGCYVDIEAVVRKTVREIGYTRAKYGFDCDSCAVVVSLKGQSLDIAQGVDKPHDLKEIKSNEGINSNGDNNSNEVIKGNGGNNGSQEELGAGDQGMMFGYATDETPTFMPWPIHLSHEIARRLDAARKSGEIDYLRPDGKTQVTIEYHNDIPKRVHTIVLSAQHRDAIDYEQLQKDIITKIIKPACPPSLIDEDTRFFINPTGRFVIGGPKGDVGLTGRKIIVDTYGGAARHGGGAFSGKDPTKVDRSGAYAARHIAKNIVAAKLASKCEVQVAYAIGVAKPVSVSINTFGTNNISDEDILALINKHFDLSPAGIIRDLDLRRPIYRQTAAYGHFGRPDIDLPWERLNKVDALKADIM